MNNVVSLEMAVKLRECGFPQTPFVGAVYYVKLWGIQAISYMEHSWIQSHTPDYIEEVIAIAPCATELLPINWTLQRVTGRWRVSNNKGFELNFANPSDAAAAAWLYMNKLGYEDRE